ncbi:MAG: GCN5-related N-acetyltransferase [Rhodospirillales bacterium]|nr:GCN5-related N-acetyltransferase [Rhodospirillales bacterium]
MPDPADLPDHEVALPDGTHVRIRPVGPDDAPRFYANFLHATEEDLRNRFFEALPSLPDELVSRLARYDRTREIALVAVPLPGADGPLDAYGVARLSRDPAPGSSAELALIVRHDWQRRGVGRALTRALLEAAQRYGVLDIWALVLRENRPMLRLLAGFGFTVAVEPGDPMLVRARWTSPLARAVPVG